MKANRQHLLPSTPDGAIGIGWLTDNPPPPPQNAAASGLTPVEGDPAKLTCVVLKKLLSERELSTAGLKAALVARLKAALEEEQK